MTQGVGPAVVLVHGALGDYRQWQSIGDFLSRDYRAIAVSRRFHWPNPIPAGDVVYTFEAHSADLAALLKSFDVPVHLVGHSWGAGVTLLAAIAHPELVRSLTLIEPPFASLASPSAPEFAGELASRNALVMTVQAKVQAGAVEQAAEALVDWVQGAAGSLPRLPSAIQQGLLANAPTVGPTIAAAAPRVTCDEVRAMRLPVLVIRGERTRPWYRLIADAAAACIPGAEAAIVPDASHMVIVEQPAATATLIHRFLERH
jgi:pimeloyl-ACP methyl ester carboxylesterase